MSRASTPKAPKETTNEATATSTPARAATSSGLMPSPKTKAFKTAFAHWEGIDAYLITRCAEGDDADYSKRLNAVRTIVESFKDFEAPTDMVSMLATQARIAKSWTVTLSGGMVGSKRFTNLLTAFATDISNGNITPESVKADLLAFERQKDEASRAESAKMGAKAKPESDEQDSPRPGQ